MTSDSMFVLAVALLTLGGVFGYLVRVEALARRLEGQVRDDDLEPLDLNGAPPISAPLEPREMPRLP